MNELDNILGRIAETEEEPSAGHFDRFSDKLRNQEIRNLFSFWLKIAAIFVLCYLSADLYLSVNSRRSESLALTKDQKEIKDAGVYYTNQINTEMNKLENLVKEGAGSERDITEIRKEFNEMDNQFRNLTRDYQSNPSDERLRNAVIQYYQSKLEIVNIVKSDLENVKQQKIKYHESNKI